jgi:hypothetical protein
MHSPDLLLQILALRLELTLCDPHDTAALQSAIDELQKNICLISKVPLSQVKAVCDSRFPAYVVEQQRAGLLIQQQVISSPGPS